MKHGWYRDGVFEPEWPLTPNIESDLRFLKSSEGVEIFEALSMPNDKCEFFINGNLRMLIKGKFECPVT